MILFFRRWFGPLGLLLLTPALWAGAPDLFADGTRAYKAGEWNRAAAVLGQLVSQYPEDAKADDAAFLRAVALWQAGEFAASADLLEKYPRQFPQSPYLARTNLWLGKALSAQNLWAEARNALEKQAGPAGEPGLLPESLNLLAAVYQQLGQKAEALAACQRLLDLTPPTVYQAAALLRAGLLAWDLGQNPAALGYLARVQTEFPDSAEAAAALFQSAEIYLSLQDWPRAEERYRRYLAGKDPRYGETSQLHLAQSLAGQNRWKEAVQAADRLEKDFPQSKELLPLYPSKAQWAEKAGDRSLALAVYASWAALEKDPTGLQKVRHNRAVLLAEAGEFAAAAQAFEQAAAGPDRTAAEEERFYLAVNLAQAGKPLPAVQAFEEFLSRYPQSARREEAGTAALSLYGSLPGKQAEEIKLLGLLIRDFPKSKELPVRLMRRAGLLTDKADYAGALFDYQRLSKEFAAWPQRPEADYKIGVVYSLRGEHPRAEAAFFKLAEEQKSGELYERALLGRGLAFLNQGQEETAAGVFTRLIREAPEGQWTSQAQFYRAKAWLKAGKPAQAQTDYLEAWKRLKEPELKAEALWQAAQSASQNLDFVQARQLYQTWAAEYPKAPRAAEARYRQGLAAFDGGDLAAAEADWLASLKAGGAAWAPETRYQLVLLKIAAKNLPAAETALGKLAADWPGHALGAEAWFRLAEAHQLAGSVDEAVRCFKAAASRYPQTAQGKSALLKAGNALFQAGRAEEALGLFLDSLKTGTPVNSLEAARTLGAQLAAAGQPGLWTLVDQALPQLSDPLVRTELVLARARANIDTAPEASLASLEAVFKGAAPDGQKSEALLIAADHYLRQAAWDKARDYYSLLGGVPDPVLAARSRLGLAQVLEGQGQVAQAAEEFRSLGLARGSLGEVRLQALYLGVRALQKLGKTSEADKLRQVLLRDGAGSSWAAKLNS